MYVYVYAYMYVCLDVCTFGCECTLTLCMCYLRDVRVAFAFLLSLCHFLHPYTNTYTYTYTYTYTNTYTYTYTYKYTDMFTYILTYKNTVDTHICTLNIHTHTHTHTYIHTHTHIPDWEAQRYESHYCSWHPYRSMGLPSLLSLLPLPNIHNKCERERNIRWCMYMYRNDICVYVRMYECMYVWMCMYVCTDGMLNSRLIISVRNIAVCARDIILEVIQYSIIA